MLMDEQHLLKQIEILQRKVQRERGGREQAEHLLESKSRELYYLNQKLTDTLDALKKHEVQLVQQEKLASIGLLAAGVAHEINTPTGYVVSNLDTLSDYINDIKQCHQQLKSNSTLDKQQYEQAVQQFDLAYIMEDLPSLIDTTIDGMRRIKGIVDDLRAYSREGEQSHQQACIDDLITETLHLTENQLKYHVDVVKDLNCKTVFYCEVNKLSQVFLNLIINAGQAIEGEGKLTIRSQEYSGHIEVVFADNGCGMDKETLLKLFDPFFTTKPLGKGTGIGLYIANDIIRNHQGEIKVDSELGKGTTFTVILPKLEPGDDDERPHL